MSELAFSIVLIARNEAHSLPRLFESLREYSFRGGEIVIVDTGSEDETVALAQSSGARVIEAAARFDSLLSGEQTREVQIKLARGGEVLPLETGQRLFDFAAAREFAAACATRDFIFMPDASDELAAFDFEWLHHQLSSGIASGFRYWLQYGTAQLIQSRFYDRRLLEWRGRVHEALFGRAGVPDWGTPPILDCEKTRLWLHHHKGNKTRPYLAGLALDWLDDPENPRRQYYLGRELFYLGKWYSALPLLLAHAANEAAWSAERNDSLCLAGQCFEALGDDDAAQREYCRASSIDTSRREPLLRLARLSTRRGDFSACVEYSRAALAITKRGVFAEVDENYTHLPHALLYWSLFWSGGREEAKLHWQKCRELAPENPKFLADARLFGELCSALA